MLAAKAIKIIGGDSASASYAGYPRWSYDLGGIHGIIILPAALLAACVMSADSYLESSFYLNPWDTTDKAHVALTQVQCACMGYLLKDFILYDGLEIAFSSTTSCLLRCAE